MYAVSDAHPYKTRQHYGRKKSHHHTLLTLDLSKIGNLLSGLGRSRKGKQLESSLTPSSSKTSTVTVPSVASSFSLASLPSESSSFSHFLSKPIPEPTRRKISHGGQKISKVSGQKVAKLNDHKMPKLPTKAADIKPNITSIQQSNMWITNMKQESQALSNQMNELKNQFSFTFGTSKSNRLPNKKKPSIGSSWETSSSFSRKSLPQYNELQHLYYTYSSFKLRSPIRSSSTAMGSTYSSLYGH